ncbi:MAG: hypothetical protein KBT11_04215 [Treponema sp.]|nr:hypothetical protein [Candidatus Treponema equifaecale]
MKKFIYRLFLVLSVFALFSCSNALSKINEESTDIGDANLIINLVSDTPGNVGSARKIYSLCDYETSFSVPSNPEDWTVYIYKVIDGEVSDEPVIDLDFIYSGGAVLCKLPEGTYMVTAETRFYISKFFGRKIVTLENGKKSNVTIPVGFPKIGTGSITGLMMAIPYNHLNASHDEIFIDTEEKVTEIVKKFSIEAALVPYDTASETVTFTASDDTFATEITASDGDGTGKLFLTLKKASLESGWYKLSLKYVPLGMNTSIEAVFDDSLVEIIDETELDYASATYNYYVTAIDSYKVHSFYATNGTSKGSGEYLNSRINFASLIEKLNANLDDWDVVRVTMYEFPEITEEMAFPDDDRHKIVVSVYGQEYNSDSQTIPSPSVISTCTIKSGNISLYGKHPELPDFNIKCYEYYGDDKKSSIGFENRAIFMINDRGYYFYPASSFSDIEGITAKWYVNDVLSSAEIDEDFGITLDRSYFDLTGKNTLRLDLTQSRLTKSAYFELEFVDPSRGALKNADGNDIPVVYKKSNNTNFYSNYAKSLADFSPDVGSSMGRFAFKSSTEIYYAAYDNISDTSSVYYVDITSSAEPVKCPYNLTGSEVKAIAYDKATKKLYLVTYKYSYGDDYYLEIIDTTKTETQNSIVGTSPYPKTSALFAYNDVLYMSNEKDISKVTANLSEDGTTVTFESSLIIENFADAENLALGTTNRTVVTDFYKPDSEENYIYFIYKDYVDYEDLGNIGGSKTNFYARGGLARFNMTTGDIDGDFNFGWTSSAAWTATADGTTIDCYNPEIPADTFTGFFGPQKIVAINDKKIIIQDCGQYMVKGKDKRTKRQEGFVTVDLDKLSSLSNAVYTKINLNDCETLTVSAGFVAE